MTKLKVDESKIIQEMSAEEMQAIHGGIKDAGRRWAFTSPLGELQPERHIGIFAIQPLTWSQTETLASSVEKKDDDTGKGVIQKIG